MTGRVLAVGQVWREPDGTRRIIVRPSLGKYVHYEEDGYVYQLDELREHFNAWIDRTGAVLVAG